MRNRIRHLCVFLVVLALGGAGGAEPPPDVNYQGRLLDLAGEPLPGPVDLQIWIFDQPTDGTQLYAEDHQGVALQDGVFNVLLGTGANAQGTFDAQLFASTNRWLEVVVDGEILEPRQPFNSVAYAFQSQESQTAADADTLDGFDASALDQSAHVGDTANPHGVTAGQTGAVTAEGINASIATHSGDASAHHAKTESFAELSDQAANGQIPDQITRDSELTTGLSGKSDVGHDHDRHYYTQAQVDAMLAAQETRIAALEALLSGVTRSKDLLTFSGMNVQVLSGSGATDGLVNGLGNLIIGYNEPRVSGNDRTGSHNLIVGQAHNFSSYGGLVVGQTNTISGAFASVSGGLANTASGDRSSVSGGSFNVASGFGSSVSGGEHNKALGGGAAVLGGGGPDFTGQDGNVAIAAYSAIVGGRANQAGDMAGGPAVGQASTVCGGRLNQATGFSSSVSGGQENIASGTESSVSGGVQNEASGNNASVSGGLGHTASGTHDWRAGSLFEDQ